ncbi:galactosylceramide sulfotransferase-like [Tropilaelaps mercedesae]|uniref:Galactosylceramide sulfotransferase-like n=1 Tax=Tropilaelaps mercedesae TaxID=418985 RepID=A0A1V9WZZ0_9ACAR|nr:galactosylceramide sulfotransferase-like [Tropilaelaps mercedesae]
MSNSTMFSTRFFRLSSAAHTLSPVLSTQSHVVCARVLPSWRDDERTKRMKPIPRQLFMLTVCATSIFIIFHTITVTTLVESGHLQFFQPNGLNNLNESKASNGQVLISDLVQKPPEDLHEQVVSTRQYEAQMAVSSNSVRPACSPILDVFFLKTHKTASSTVFNILMRIHRRPQIFAVHTRLDIREAKRIMPSASKFITILRHPLQAWASGYNYFLLARRTGQALGDFVFDNFSIEFMRRRSFSKWFGFNMMFFDMGFQENRVESPKEQANKAINMLEEHFDLVMIAEFMEESLILLKRELCWQLGNIVAFRHNERNSSVHLKSFEKDVAQKIIDLNEIDMRIYNYFYQKLRKRIDEYGREQMTREVRSLRLSNKYWADRCISGYTHGFSETVEFIPYAVGPAVCKRLTLKETLYINKFRKRYISELRKVLDTGESFAVAGA